LHYRQWDFWHLTTCGRISVPPYKHQPHHRPIRIFKWMDSYAVLAAALFLFHLSALTTRLSYLDFSCCTWPYLRRTTVGILVGASDWVCGCWLSVRIEVHKAAEKQVFGQPQMSTPPTLLLEYGPPLPLPLTPLMRASNTWGI